MAGIKIERFLFLAFLTIGAAFVAVTFWHSIFRGGWSCLLGIGLFFLVPAILIANIVIALVRKSKLLWWAILINAFSVGMFIPAMRFGNMIRDDIFLANLSTYQAITNSLINQEKLEPHFSRVYFPPDFSSVLVSNYISIERGADDSVTVLFFTRDSFALGHCGYLYRSDDNEAVVKREHPDIGLFRLAPKWFEWAD